MKKFANLTFRLKVQLAAPHTFVASLYPTIFAILFCKIKKYNLTLFQSFVFIVATIFMQSAANILNDYFDYIKGTDSIDDNVEKSDATLLYNNINPKAVLTLGIVCLAIGVIFGLLGCIEANFSPVIIGIIGAVIVLLYSAGPKPLSYLPIGEIISGTVMGALIPLAIISASKYGRIDMDVLIYSIPFIIGIALIMMSNNGCDIEKDIKAGRLTLPVLIGRKNTLIIYKSMMVLWLIVLFILSVTLLGIVGFVTPILIIFTSYKIFKFLFISNLSLDNRIKQMKNIVMANIFGNGAYIIAILLKACLGGIGCIMTKQSMYLMYLKI